MEKDVDDRFESAMAMRAALQDFLQLHQEGKTHIYSGDFPTMDLRLAKNRKVKTRAEREAEEEARRERRRTWLLAAIAAVVVLGGISLSGWAVIRFLDVPEVPVPEGIIGLPLPTVDQMLTAAKLNSKVVADRYSDLPVNHVIEADPAPGTMVKQAATINLVVSKGPEQVELPDVRGYTEDEARIMLENARFKVGDVEYRVSTEPEGTVIATAPAARTPLKVGYEVDLIVSRGPLRVPDIVGKSLDEATKLLAEMGLTVGSVERRPDRMPADTVLSANPAPGTPMTPGQTVDLVLSLGTEATPRSFRKELRVPGLSTQSVRYQVIVVDVVDGAASERLLVDQTLNGGQTVIASGTIYGDAHLIVKVNGVERTRVALP